MKRESFVIHAEYIDDLPDEYKGAFLMYIYDYGINGNAPELTGLENAIWLKIKRRIDADTSTYDKKIRNLRQFKTSDTDKTLSDTDNTESLADKALSDTDKALSDTENIESVADKALSDTDKALSDSVYVSVNDTEFVNDDVCVSEFPGLPPESTHTDTRQPKPAQDYADKIFNIFKTARLPCCNNNIISFMQRDFYQGLQHIHKNIPGLHSDEVIKACKNYALLSTNPLLYKGYSRHLSFDQLVTKNWFKKLLPGNFFESDFLEHSEGETPPVEKQMTPEEAEQQLLLQMKDNNNFIPGIFKAYKDDWIADGRPTGNAYMNFQTKKELAPYGKKLKEDFIKQKVRI